MDKMREQRALGSSVGAAVVKKAPEEGVLMVACHFFPHVPKASP